MENRFTGTGLDRLVEIIESDTGVQRRVSDSELDKGAQAAGELNHLLLEGIETLGLVNDGRLDRSDLRGLSDWIQSDPGRKASFLDLYGRNAGGSETGFQLVQNEDSDNRLFGEDAIDEVADAIYSLGFGYDGEGRSIDVNGNPYRSLNDTARWFNDLLTDADVEALKNPEGDLVFSGTTGTGLDRIIEVIQDDPGVIRNVSKTDIVEGARAADKMNQMYLDGIRELGLAEDGEIDKSEIFALDEWVRADAGRHEEFLELHESWRLVLNKGADLATYGGIDDYVHPHVGHVVNHALKGIYEIGFGSKGNLLLDHQGKADVSAIVPARWFDGLLTDADKQGLDGRGEPPAPSEPEVPAEPAEPTEDPGEPAGAPAPLLSVATTEVGALSQARRISHETSYELSNGTLAFDVTPESSSGRQGLVSKDATNLGDGGHITVWIEDGRITARLQSDTGSHDIGGGSVKAGETASVAVTFGSGGFKLFVDGDEVGRSTYKGGLQNNSEPIVLGASAWGSDAGSASKLTHEFKGTISDFGLYGEALSQEEIRGLATPSGGSGQPAPSGGSKDDSSGSDGDSGGSDPSFDDGGSPSSGSLVFSGTTGTGLDRIIEVIQDDPGVIRNVSKSDIVEGARAADKMNQMYLDGIEALGLSNDGKIDKSEIFALDEWVRADAGRHGEFLEQHKSWRLVLDKGADLATYGGIDDYVHPHVGHVVNHALKGIYEIGFGSKGNLLLDHQGKADVSAIVPARWFDGLLTDADMGSLENAEGALAFDATTGTGLDRMVDLVQNDPGLIRNLSRSDINEGARAVDGMNRMIVEAIDTLSLDRDGKISSGDVREISSYVQASDERADQFEFLFGNDTNGTDTGFQEVWNQGGTTKMFDLHAVNVVADAIYHVGFDIKDTRFYDEDGNWSEFSVYRVANYIDELYFG